jgi:hypothetical protein
MVMAAWTMAVIMVMAVPAGGIVIMRMRVGEIMRM